jgi:hypothetical protein
MTQVVCGPGSVSLWWDSFPERSGHPGTFTIQNDLAGILWALFVPFETLPSLFNDVHEGDYALLYVGKEARRDRE